MHLEASPLGALLGQLRQAAGLSQGELARQARLTRPYITQLESGKRLRPSRQTALNLATALQLGAEQRQVFLAAAGWPDLEVNLRGDEDNTYALARQVVDTSPFPAALHDSCWLVGHANQHCHAFFDALQAPLTPQLSLLERVFHPVIRPQMSDWETWARAMLAQFRRDSLHLAHTPAQRAFLQRLRALPDFERLWRSVEPSTDTVPKMALPLNLPATGPCLVEVLRFQVVGLPDLWMVYFMPSDAAAQRLVSLLLETAIQSQGRE